MLSQIHRHRALMGAAAGVLLLASGSAAAPPEQGAARPVLRAADINAALNLTASSVVTLDVDPAAVGAALRVDLPIGGLTYQLELRPHSVRAAGFRLIEHRADGTERDIDPGPVNTLRGTVAGVAGSAVAGGMLADGLYLTVIFPDGQQFWVEPLIGRVEGAAKDQYVLYRSGDALAGGFCGTTDDQRAAGDHADHADHAPGSGGERGATLWTAQMATDADVEFHNRWGGTTNANSRIQLVTNTMNLQYERDVDITHSISVTRVRTAEPDPYSTTNAATLNAQIVTAWTGDPNTKDVIQLFTGKEIDGGTIGRANAIGSICASQNSSCFSQSDFDNNFSSATDLSAHELGHLWDGVHCTCSSPPSTMNPFITSVNRFGVNGNDSADTSIPAYRNTRVCLATSGSTTPPPNDLCADAERIFPGTYGFSNALAANDGPAACGLIGADIWYLYIAPCNGSVTVDTCGETGFDTVLVAYSGLCGGLTELVCNDDGTFCGGGDPPRQSRISFDVTAGTTYRIRLGGFNGITGTGILTLSQATCPTPVNNGCGSATPVSANTDTLFSTFGATTDGGLESLCLSSGDNTIGSDIWYSWLATCTDAVSVSLCGSSFDTKVAVYAACPAGINQAIVCNDDFCGLQSSVTFNATAGTTYRIRIGGYNNQVGTGTFRVNACPPPANDSCASAVNVSAGGTFNGTLVVATNDGTASCGSSTANADVWYAFTAPVTGCGSRLTVTTCGTHDTGGTDAGMDTVLGLFASCGGAELGCNDDTLSCAGLDAGSLRDSALSRDLAPGETVWIRVSKFSTVTPRPFVLNVSFGPANDGCASALAATLGSTPFCTLGATNDGPAEVGQCHQNNDVWFSFTATCTAPVRVTTCGADYDSEIGVYPAGCPAVGPAIACNDDSCGFQSQVTFPAASGTTYLIRVGGFSAASRGTGTMVIGVAADWNGDGAINSSDISSYLTSWLASLTAPNFFADFNNDNAVNSSDISAFLTAWLAGVTNC